MKNEWTMAAFLAEHDKKWEAEIADLKIKLAVSETENKRLSEELDRVTNAYNAMHDNVLSRFKVAE